jgi:hypothetical protein
MVPQPTRRHNVVAATIARIPSTHDDQLLPNLADQSGREVFEVIHGVEDHRIGETFGVQSRHFANEREQLAGIVEVAAQLKLAKRPLWRRGRRTRSHQDGLGIFGQLVHVHDVRDGSEIVNHAKRAAALETIL